MPATLTDRQKDEARIQHSLDALLKLSPEDPARKPFEDELLEIVDRHFREVIKPLLLSVFRKATGEAGTARFTAMMNDFFIKVLDQRPNAFWRAKSAAELRKWASVVLSNQIKNYLKRENKYRQLEDDIGGLVEERQRFFKNKTGIELTPEVLDLVDSWCLSEDKKSLGWTLRHRFVDGMTRDQIADQLGVSLHTTRMTLEQAITELKVIYAAD